MARPVLVDTNVMIEYLRGSDVAVEYVRSNADRILLSCIVIAELYAGVKGDQELAALDKVSSVFPVVPLTGEIARAGGLLKRDYGKSHGVGLADALLAATAQSEDAELATLNIKHFPMFKGIKVPYART